MLMSKSKFFKDRKASSICSYWKQLKVLIYIKLHFISCCYLLIIYAKKASQKVKTDEILAALALFVICTRIATLRLCGKMHTFSTNQTRVIFSCTLLINLPVSSCAFICLWMNLFISRSLILASCRSFQRFIIKRACLSPWYSVCQPKKSSYSVSDVRRTLNI